MSTEDSRDPETDHETISESEVRSASSFVAEPVETNEHKQ